MSTMALVEGDRPLDPKVPDSDPNNDDNGKSDEAKPEDTSILMCKLLLALERQQKPGPSGMGEHLGTDGIALSTMSVWNS